MSISTSRTQSAATTSTQSQRIVAAVSAAVLGAFLVYFAGFSHIDAVHNAAHDTRHSSAFPCH
ncbi:MULTISPECIES: CbtB domain-containing protein [Pseudomonas]|uniref:CbtB-domain containing protein n=1 Tax=Pseudomonas weihenstephanensis TaxID=1608994 RepID=A0ABS1ZKF1_9PSED|nr:MULTISPECIES: CbtB-domain containing protein [Pseudomonas]KVV08864.1 cobalt transporter subunit CbtB (proposed) [Pseudomonas sp. TAD18]KVV09681.1 cobalt transporter subunit CbtB (proposed) [Pseudomonas sp. TAA207]MBM1196951.1 CbtB-domain containing protein [Pseudomonas weihenstephanensis]